MADIRDITVIIPAKIRNEEEAKWLKIAYSSVPTQVGIVIVNDHSLIPWKRVMEISSLPDGNIYHLTNKTGLAAARNEAMKHVETPYFFPLDADDYLMPDALEIALSSYPGNGFLYGSTILFNDKQRTTYKARPFDICKLCEAVYWPNGCLQKTENFHAIGGWDESLILYEDWDYWLRSFKAGIHGHSIDAVLYCYRQNPNGIIQTLKRNSAMASRAREIIQTRHKDLFDGVYPMAGCCGGKMARKATASTSTTKVVAKKTTTASIPAPLQKGMVLLTYLGSGLTRSFYGPSGTMYRFSSTSRKTGYVAEEDVAALLRMKENGQPLFSR